MNIIDTHSHFYFPDIEENFQAIRKNVQESGVKTQILIGCDEISNLAALDLAQRYPEEMRVVLGVHPCDVDKIGNKNPESHRYHRFQDYQPFGKTVPQFFSWLENIFLAHQNLVVGFGETGFDRFHRDTPDLLALQTECFEKHLDLCQKYTETLVIHSRSATGETLNFLQNHKSKIIHQKCIWHCFTENLETAKKAISMGISLGIGGILTYPKSDTLRMVVTQVPLKFLVTETDCPFLVPQNARKSGITVNHPGFLPEVIEQIATLKNMEPEKCAEILYQNGKNIFGL